MKQFAKKTLKMRNQYSEYRIFLIWLFNVHTYKIGTTNLQGYVGYDTPYKQIAQNAKDTFCPIS